MKSDLYTAIAQIAAERGIPRDAVISSVQQALTSVYKKTMGSEEDVAVELDQATGEMQVVILKTVVETVVEPNREISLEDAKAHEPGAQIGDAVKIKSTPENFGRIAAQTVKQVVHTRIRDFERESVFREYQDKEGEVLSGVVQRADSRAVIIELGKAEAVMPAREQVPTERYRTNQRIKVLVTEVNSHARGPQLIVSRSNAGLIRRLFEQEVPEIQTGAVEIMEIAREPGLRSKVAVAARQEKVDPVGSCVGVRGVRIQNIVNELYGEKIDVIEWSSDIATFIANALSPAKPTNVSLSEHGEHRVATVIVPSDQMSLAIGKEGQNARLAYKLTGWRIDIKGPESLLEAGGEFFRSARDSASDLMPDFNYQGRQPRPVQADGMVALGGMSYGPLSSELVRRQVDVEAIDGVVEIYYDRELRARFDQRTGTALPLDGDGLDMPAATELEASSVGDGERA
ncbi:MAG: Transcription termination protein NusA [uncultured Thermomicrobiales bacterium]|uniref:Transcription termination/antitermination protein NusA n=2 Tax=uncultured Thermomicrobiales bacterium TaxID=1645740 RepID=A0A6J4UZ80_9BACT|nr:MAG: Transcription termination protein NusA [uncultured Thermomicrobiales bacterium]